MIGDWIKTSDNANWSEDARGIICRITNLDDNYITATDTNNFKCLYGSSINFEPILLTKEILEKNGWEHCKVETCKSLWEYRGLHLHHVMIKRSNGRWVANIDGRKIEVGCESSYLRINIYYVHQLQNAIKLCEWDKTIEL